MDGQMDSRMDEWIVNGGEYEQSEDQMNDGGIDGWINEQKNRPVDNGRWRDRWMRDNGTFLFPYLSVKFKIILKCFLRLLYIKRQTYQLLSINLLL